MDTASHMAANIQCLVELGDAPIEMVEKVIEKRRELVGSLQSNLVQLCIVTDRIAMDLCCERQTALCMRGEAHRRSKLSPLSCNTSWQES